MPRQTMHRHIHRLQEHGLVIVRGLVAITPTGLEYVNWSRASRAAIAEQIEGEFCAEETKTAIRVVEQMADVLRERYL